jgi:hypothetical protein
MKPGNSGGGKEPRDAAAAKTLGLAHQPNDGSTNDKFNYLGFVLPNPQLKIVLRIYTIKNAKSNASHRQLEAQPFAVPWRAVHSGPSPATAWPRATGSTRVSAARRENHSQDCSMHRTVADSARNARGPDRFALRRPGARLLGFQRGLPFRQFCGRAIPPLRTGLDRNKRAGSTRGEARFAGSPERLTPHRRDRRCWPRIGRRRSRSAYDDAFSHTCKTMHHK